MTTEVMPIIRCDGDDGWCGAWSIDYYTEGASAVGGIPITRERPALDWIATGDDEHYCPEHAEGDGE